MPSGGLWLCEVDCHPRNGTQRSTEVENRNSLFDIDPLQFISLTLSCCHLSAGNWCSKGGLELKIRRMVQ